MGDALAGPQIGSPEAIAIWLTMSTASITISLLPLLFVFRDAARRAKWREKFGGKLPWVTSTTGALLYMAFAVAFILCSAFSYWTSRGGHTFGHRKAVAICQYATLLIVALWSWPVLWNWHLGSGLLLALATIGYGVYTVFAFLAKPWWAGLISIFGCLSLACMTVVWMRSMVMKLHGRSEEE